MSGLVVCLASAMLGIDTGWQPLPGGGLEYIIQVEPHLVHTLGGGDPLGSQLPPYLKDVRAYRIVVGTAELPRIPSREQLEREAAEALAAEQRAAAQTPPDPIFVDPGVKPIGEQQAAFIQKSGAKPAEKPKTPKSEDPKPKQKEPEPSKPWLPVTLALFALAASCGGNIYMGWITRDARRRYRDLLIDGDSDERIGATNVQ